ncbi:MAG: dTMP kinase [Firmicutes bacterium]|nr:dTMP kinase [Bacillota bacterium]
MSDPLRFYGVGLPYLPQEGYPGKLIVVEGQDGSGRSTQVRLLARYLELRGHAVVETGLARSNLIADVIEESKQGHTLGERTMSLLYATDFADQVENVILPSLGSGAVVLADRYLFSLVARSTVRGLDPHWVRTLYGFAPVPDAIFYLRVPPQTLLYRAFGKSGRLDYWESGMDLALSTDRFTSFLEYQQRIYTIMETLCDEYGFHVLDGEQRVDLIQEQLRRAVTAVIEEGGQPGSALGDR